MKRKPLAAATPVSTLRLSGGCARAPMQSVVVEGKGIGIGSNGKLHSRVTARCDGKEEKLPDPIDDIARRIGYRVHPSWIWAFENGGHPGPVLGMVNDGIAGVPGISRLSVFGDDGKVHASGPRYAKPHGVRQAMLTLPPGKLGLPSADGAGRFAKASAQRVARWRLAAPHPWPASRRQLSC